MELFNITAVCYKVGTLLSKVYRYFFYPKLEPVR